MTEETENQKTLKKKRLVKKRLYVDKNGRYYIKHKGKKILIETNKEGMPKYVPQQVQSTKKGRTSGGRSWKTAAPKTGLSQQEKAAQDIAMFQSSLETKQRLVQDQLTGIQSNRTYAERELEKINQKIIDITSAHKPTREQLVKLQKLMMKQKIHRKKLALYETAYKLKQQGDMFLQSGIDTRNPKNLKNSKELYGKANELLIRAGLIADASRTESFAGTSVINKDQAADFMTSRATETDQNSQGGEQQGGEQQGSQQQGQQQGQQQQGAHSYFGVQPMSQVVSENAHGYGPRPQPSARQPGPKPQQPQARQPGPKPQQPTYKKQPSYEQPSQEQELDKLIQEGEQLLRNKQEQQQKQQRYEALLKLAPQHNQMGYTVSEAKDDIKNIGRRFGFKVNWEQPDEVTKIVEQLMNQLEKENREKELGEILYAENFMREKEQEQRQEQRQEQGHEQGQEQEQRQEQGQEQGHEQGQEQRQERQNVLQEQLGYFNEQEEDSRVVQSIRNALQLTNKTEPLTEEQKQKIRQDYYDKTHPNSKRNQIKRVQEEEEEARKQQQQQAQQQPVQQPVQQQPVSKPPVQQPVQQQPVQQQPVSKPPVQQQPVSKPPVQQQPVSKPPVSKPPQEQTTDEILSKIISYDPIRYINYYNVSKKDMQTIINAYNKMTGEEGILQDTVYGPEKLDQEDTAAYYYNNKHYDIVGSYNDYKNYKEIPIKQRNPKQYFIYGPNLGKEKQIMDLNKPLYKKLMQNLEQPQQFLDAMKELQQYGSAANIYNLQRLIGQQLNVFPVERWMPNTAKRKELIQIPIKTTEQYRQYGKEMQKLAKQTKLWAYNDFSEMPNWREIAKKHKITEERYENMYKQLQQQTKQVENLMKQQEQIFKEQDIANEPSRKIDYETQIIHPLPIIQQEFELHEQQGEQQQEQEEEKAQGEDECDEDGSLSIQQLFQLLFLGIPDSEDYQMILVDDYDKVPEIEKDKQIFVFFFKLPGSKCHHFTIGVNSGDNEFVLFDPLSRRSRQDDDKKYVQKIAHLISPETTFKFKSNYDTPWQNIPNDPYHFGKEQSNWCGEFCFCFAQKYCMGDSFKEASEFDSRNDKDELYKSVQFSYI